MSQESSTESWHLRHHQNGRQRTLNTTRLFRSMNSAAPLHRQDPSRSRLLLLLANTPTKAAAINAVSLALPDDGVSVLREALANVVEAFSEFCACGQHVLSQTASRVRACRHVHVCLSTNLSHPLREGATTRYLSFQQR